MPRARATSFCVACIWLRLRYLIAVAVHACSNAARQGVRSVHSCCIRCELVGCTRRHEFIGRSIRAGSRGAYRCKTRLSRGGKSPGRNYCAQCSAMNRSGCCCSAARLCMSPPPAPAPGQLDIPTTRQMQLAAAPKLLPPPEMSCGMPHTAVRKVQGRLLIGIGQQGDRVLMSSSAGVHTALGR